ncbi:MAG TPA: zinc ribbon domain-containing protein [Blastocatellia bacterium]|nr:zinc ribbon domain-containing protein [Blastocatellia bacterium]
MYCPKCGTQNLEDIKYCRSCGANLSLVPQALSGEFTQERAVGHDAEGKPYDRHGRRMHHQPSLASGIQTAFAGTAFLIIAIVLFLTGQKWGLWMLIPAFAILGKGVGEIAASKQSQPQLQSAPPPARTTGELPPEHSYGALPQSPPSVTENTTRHLDATREQRPRETR